MRKFELGSIFTHLIYGKERCVLCHDFAATHGICTGCRHDLAALRRAASGCATCFLPAPPSTPPTSGTTIEPTPETCPACRKRLPAFERLFASYIYRAPLSSALHRLKYQQQTTYLSPLIHAMLEAPPPWLDTFCATCIIAMPISRERLLLRGFNQSAWLADGVSRHSHLPLLNEATCTRRHTVPQSQLKRKAREHNVRGIFTLHADLTGQRVLIIDDVATTRATLDSLARALKAAGAEAVAAWVLMTRA